MLVAIQYTKIWPVDVFVSPMSCFVEKLFNDVLTYLLLPSSLLLLFFIVIIIIIVFIIITIIITYIMIIIVTLDYDISLFAIINLGFEW